MNILERIQLAAFGTNSKALQKEAEKLRSAIGLIKDGKFKYPSTSRIFRVDKDIRNWKDYIDRAKTAPYYDRYELHELYETQEFDAHLFAQVQTRKNKSKSEGFTLLDANGNESEAAKQVFNGAWIQQLMDSILNSVFWGSYGCELFVQDGQIMAKPIHAKHLNLDRNIILPEPKYKTVYVPIDYDLFPNLLIFGDTGLGVYAIASRYAIYKGFSYSDWARHSERFGTPFVYYKSDSAGEELDKLENMLSNFGNNGWVIGGTAEDMSYLIDTRNNPHEMYLKMVELSEQQISKAIVGQTGTSEEKSYVGSAEVHERILETYARADMNLIKHYINDKVIPLLLKLGVAELEGMQFEFQYFLDPTPDSTDEQKEASELSYPFGGGCC